MVKKQVLVLLCSATFVMTACNGGGGGDNSSAPAASAGKSVDPSGSTPSSQGPSGQSSSSSSSSSVTGPSLTFVSNGGTEIATVTGKKGDKIDYSKYVTTREGYEFVKWSGDIDGKSDAPATLSDGNTKVYAIWAGDFERYYVYYGHYPQTKVTDSALASKIKSQGESLGGGFYKYQGKQYYFTALNDCYESEYIRWKKSYVTTNPDDKKYYLTADSVLFYAPIFESLPLGFSNMSDYEKNEALEFEKSDIYAWLHNSFAKYAFSSEEMANIFAVTLPEYNGKNMVEDIRDWVSEASEYALSLGDKFNHLFPIPYGDRGEEAYPYWFRTQNTASPGTYYMRSPSSLGGGPQREFYDSVTKNKGIVPQIEVDMNEPVTKTIHFNPMGGEAVEDYVVHTKAGRDVFMDPHSLPDEHKPVKEGYVFNQWYYDEAYEHPVYGNTGIRIPASQSELTLYAHYLALSRTIKFDMDGGKEIAPLTEVYDKPKDVVFTLPETAEKKGYSFVGWYYDKAHTRPVYTKTITITTVDEREEITLYAGWKVDTASYPTNLIIHYNNGQENGQKTIYSNKTIASQIGQPTYDTYHEFAGWYLDAEFTTPLENDASSWKEESIDVYAKWNELDPDEVDFVYTPIDDGEAYAISASNDFGRTGALVIPETYNGKPITKIADNAFSNQSAITSFVIPSHIKEIGYRAFAGTSITKLELPKIKYAAGAFANMLALEEVVMDNAIEEIPGAMFQYDENITKINLPTSLKSIGDYAFVSVSFEEFTMPESVQKLGYFGAVSIEHLIWNNSGANLEYTTGDNNPFLGAEIGKMTIGADVTALNAKMVLPDNATVDVLCSLDTWVSLGAPNLAASGKVTFNGQALSGEIVIKDGATSIPKGTFYNSAVTKVTLPASLTDVASDLFAGNEKLKEVVLNGMSTQISNLVLPACVTKLTYNGPSTGVSNLGKIVKNGTGVKEVEINSETNSLSLGSDFSKIEILTLGEKTSPQALATYNNGGLTYLTNLKELTINNFNGINGYFGKTYSQVWTLPNLEKLTVRSGTVTLNNSNAIRTDVAPKLKTVILGEGVTQIGNYGFANATALESLTIEGTLTSIGNYAFQATKLESFTLPKSVTTVGNEIFKDANAMKVLKVEEGNTRYSCPDDLNIILDEQQGLVVATIPTSGDYSEYITTATEGTYSNVNTDTFVLPSKIKSVRSLAFNGAKIRVLDLSSNSSLSISSSALQGIEGLEEVILPTLTMKPTSLFGTKDEVPNLITVKGGTIPYMEKDYGVKNIVFEGATSVAATSSASKYTLRYCTNLVSFKAPKLLKVVKEMFCDCTNLTTVDVSGATTFEAGAFYGCTKLHDLDMSSVTSFDEDALKNCTSLGVLTLNPDFAYAQTPSAYNSGASGAEIEGIILTASLFRNLPTGAFRGATVGWIVMDYLIKGATNKNYPTFGSVGKVYYKGTQTQFNNYVIGYQSTYNSTDYANITANVKFYSASEAAGCWHFDEKGLPVEW